MWFLLLRQISLPLPAPTRHQHSKHVSLALTKGLQGRIFLFPKEVSAGYAFLTFAIICRHEENVSGKSFGIELLQALSLSAVCDLGQII